MIYSTYQVQQTTCLKSSLFLCTYPRRYSELGPSFGMVLVPQVKGFGSRRSQSGEIFVILGEGEAGDIKNSISTLNY